MKTWNRTDFDQLESRDRWHLVIISSDPLKGVPIWLLLYLLLSLALLALLPGMV